MGGGGEGDGDGDGAGTHCVRAALGRALIDVKSRCFVHGHGMRPLLGRRGLQALLPINQRKV